MEFLIIGGDAAGMSAASRAKRHDSNMKVTVLEKTMDVSYSACGMPYNIADPDRQIEDLVVRAAKVFREKQDIDLRTGWCAEKIDPAGHTVSARSLDGDRAEFAYDKLLIATGASAVLPDIPGIDLPGVMALKSLEEGRRIKAFIRERDVKTAAIIGMGYVALEMAEALRARGISVCMVKPRPAFLPWLDAKLAEAVREEVASNGVHLYAGHSVQRIESNNRHLEVVCDETTLAADMVLAAIGVRPNSGLAEEAGLAMGPGNAIAVDRRMQTSNADIYAAGDCADAFHLVTGRKAWIPLALRANRCGWAAADNVCGVDTEVEGVAGTAVFKAFDFEVARTGLNESEAADAGFAPVTAVIETRSRAHAHPGAVTLYVSMVGDKTSGRLLGAPLRADLGSIAGGSQSASEKNGLAGKGLKPPADGLLRNCRSLQANCARLR